MMIPRSGSITAAELIKSVVRPDIVIESERPPVHEASRLARSGLHMVSDNKPAAPPSPFVWRV